ncbi:hypothetical protein [Bifidobacterium tibiigranuli]|jgi:hypothetical protein|uniref:hypothetical protein n=1 Tax=Bifidobacterium tibiigranuli TaxID=2172043 RepID=UPI0023545F7B|nr:hypothetical protein [Bifidobacterium tibiigranuli]MCH3975049.1 hypothetical protein [Bifidobacterium tibiigranuli]MCH4202809.1 hypothetical protein [Bifidobacterium tibiigranuli]MCH4274939.1 hypothetical protein [Bifidobacterium tibiigranuli]MCI1211026.1 hypothetical protein [Bifidobacterium tibiigranuli]MCI1221791.1 hypothetical protein [Bifidobacterium tibiigranuli]
MTVIELLELLNDAQANGYGDYPVHATLGAFSAPVHTIRITVGYKVEIIKEPTE